MHELILHHYPQSPVSEKVRIVLGMKDLAWRSVEIPRLPPKPELMPLTGGYRLTPVMQIGADVYCDSQCILRELERRHPVPAIVPAGAAGLPWALGRWTDGPLFMHALHVILGHQAKDLPAAFAEDRFPLYFGPDYDVAEIELGVPWALAQLRAELGWMEQRLAGGRRFMLGDEPGLPDALCYYVVWFVRGRYAGGEAFLARFPHLVAWEARVRAIGHGRPTGMSAGEALAIAQNAVPQTPEQADPGDPEGLAPGMRASVAPEGGASPPVTGEIVLVSAESIALRRTGGRVGEVVVHFPRVGYRVHAQE